MVKIIFFIFLSKRLQAEGTYKIEKPETIGNCYLSPALVPYPQHPTGTSDGSDIWRISTVSDLTFRMGICEIGLHVFQSMQEKVKYLAII